MGFDNAHAVPPKGARYRKANVEHDHWHRTGNDKGRRYRFISADQLLADFETEVDRILTGIGIDKTVIRDSDISDGDPS